MNLKELRQQEAKEANVLEKIYMAKDIVAEVFGKDYANEPLNGVDVIDSVYGGIKNLKPAKIEEFRKRLKRTASFANQTYAPTPEEVLEMHDWVAEADDEGFGEFTEDFIRAHEGAAKAFGAVKPTLAMVLFVFDEVHGDDEDEED